MTSAPQPAHTQLTDRQRGILDFIETNMRDRGYPPSVREIGEAVGPMFAESPRDGHPQRREQHRRNRVDDRDGQHMLLQTERLRNQDRLYAKINAHGETVDRVRQRKTTKRRVARQYPEQITPPGRTLSVCLLGRNL